MVVKDFIPIYTYIGINRLQNKKDPMDPFFDLVFL